MIENGDESEGDSLDEVIFALLEINKSAKRAPRIVGDEKLPTEWDRRHADIGEKLYIIEKILIAEGEEPWNLSETATSP